MKRKYIQVQENCIGEYKVIILYFDKKYKNNYSFDIKSHTDKESFLKQYSYLENALEIMIHQGFAKMEIHIDSIYNELLLTYSKEFYCYPDNNKYLLKNNKKEYGKFLLHTFLYNITSPNGKQLSYLPQKYYFENKTFRKDTSTKEVIKWLSETYNLDLNEILRSQELHDFINSKFGVWTPIIATSSTIFTPHYAPLKIKIPKYFSNFVFNSVSDTNKVIKTLNNYI